MTRWLVGNIFKKSGEIIIALYTNRYGNDEVHTVVHVYFIAYGHYTGSHFLSLYDFYDIMTNWTVIQGQWECMGAGGGAGGGEKGSVTHMGFVM